MRVILGLTIFLTFLLINLGGLVHNTGSSLACPDWPLCYGQVMPTMEGGILVEHSHRLLASLVGFLTIVIASFLFRKRRTNPSLFKWGLIALTMVIFQGLLGGLTVIYKLPTIVSTMHLGLSMIFFITLIGIEHYTKENPNKGNSQVRLWLMLSLALVYIQMILGAFVRHSGLGGACGVGYENALMCFDVIAMKEGVPESLQAWWHFSHRILAVVAGLVVFKTAYELNRASYKKMAVLITGAVLFQITLGILTIGSSLGVWQMTLHLGGAAMLFGLLFKAYLLNRGLENFSTQNKFVQDSISLAKPRLSGLVIITAGLGMAMAPGEISFSSAIVTLLATAMIVAGACTINCFMEVEIDKLMDRTKDRPLPAGRISKSFALYLGTFLMVVFVPIIALASNLLTATLGAIACLLYVFLYTPMKRKSTLALFVGAIPGAIPPLMGWTAVTNSIGGMGVILFGILFLWQLPHFLSISLYHLNDYKKAGIKILPVSKGIFATKWRIAFYTSLLLSLSLVPISMGYEDLGYKILALLFGGAFLIYSLLGLKDSSATEPNRRWARNYFLGSIIYLPCILTLMMIYRG